MPTPNIFNTESYSKKKNVMVWNIGHVLTNYEGNVLYIARHFVTIKIILMEITEKKNSIKIQVNNGWQ